MQYTVLGELRARDQGVDRTPPGRRSRDLLAALLVRAGQAVDSSVLLDQVWGKKAPTLTVAVVHTQVARLRRTLGAGAVLTTQTGSAASMSKRPALACGRALSRKTAPGSPRSRAK